MIGGILLLALVVGTVFYVINKKSRKAKYTLPPNASALLLEHVAFYENLSEADRVIFEARVKDFLENTAVRGVDVAVDELDKLLVASSAIMLIFSFPDWRYNNISEVLLYKDTFNHDFETSGAGRRVLGMVGDGALHRIMLLSKPSLRSAFKHPVDGQHTPLHEFAHLLDKADGTIDGVPEYLIGREQVMPWIKEIRETIAKMRARGKSDIDMYGATNDAEFFAVIAEYFFEKPQKLNASNPELYDMLEEMFRTKKVD